MRFLGDRSAAPGAKLQTSSWILPTVRQHRKSQSAGTNLPSFHGRFHGDTDLKVNCKRNSCRPNAVESLEVHPNEIPPKWPDCRRKVVLKAAAQQPGLGSPVWPTCGHSD